MSFKSLLVHRCTLLIQEEGALEDDYGRPISGTIEHMNIPCRVDQARERVAYDDTGSDFILSNILFLGPAHAVDLNTKIVNIVDLDGEPVLIGSFSVKNRNPVYGRRRLHHHEITLQKE